jgi:penicillin-binding protein 1A
MINNSKPSKQRLNRIKRLTLVSYYLFKKRRRRLYIGLISLFGLGCLGLVSFIGLFIAVYFGAFGTVPDYEALSSIRNNEASEIYDKDGKLIGRYFKENRIIADSEEVPDYLLQALVATEDERFFDHSGVDPRALLRVFFRTIILRDKSGGGGSTLSQQLAKNLYPREDKGLLSMPVAKFKEMIVARRLERIYSKNELVLFYLNTVPFGRDIYGVKVAANRFFNKNVDKLKVEEAAILVGMLKANSFYDPVSNPERSESRRNIVLSQMAKNEFLAKDELDSLKAIKLVTDYVDITDENQRAAYFKAHLEKELNKILKSKAVKGSSIDLYTSGLKIYTSLDANLQSMAESAVKQEMVNLQKSFDAHWKGKSRVTNNMLFNAMRKSNRYKVYIASGLSNEEATAKFKENIEYRYYSPTSGKWRSIKRSPLDSIARALTTLHCGLLSMEANSGAVRAWVGGIDYASFQYDHVRSRRQVGSVFKPIVYMAALEKGVEPCEFMLNEKTTYVDYENWTPKNADNEYGGYYSMPGALANSVNTMAVEYLFKSGIDTVIDYAKAFGLNAKIEEVPSIALGAVEASVQEMAKVYSSILNNGQKVEAYFIERIEDAGGKTIYKRKNTLINEQVVSAENAQLMREMLKNVVDKGTAQRARYKYNVQSVAAGKTGTTSDQADGWFVGFTPGLVTSVWVGGENPSIRWRTISEGQGANTALPVWANYTKRIENSSSRKYTQGTFPAVDSTIAARLDCVFFRETELDTLESFAPWEWIKFERERLFKKEKKNRIEENTRRRKRAEQRKKYFRDLLKNRREQ